MLVVLEKHIINIGLEVIKAGSEGGEFLPKTKTQVKDALQPEAADVYVDKLMKVYTQFKDVVDQAFSTNTYFVAALDKVGPKTFSDFFFRTLLFPEFFFVFVSGRFVVFGGYIYYSI